MKCSMIPREIYKYFRSRISFVARISGLSLRAIFVFTTDELYTFPFEINTTLDMRVLLVGSDEGTLSSFLHDTEIQSTSWLT